jgi:hypothetical protein
MKSCDNRAQFQPVGRKTLRLHPAIVGIAHVRGKDFGCGVSRAASCAICRVLKSLRINRLIYLLNSLKNLLTNECFNYIVLLMNYGNGKWNQRKNLSPVAPWRGAEAAKKGA